MYKFLTSKFKNIFSSNETFILFSRKHYLHRSIFCISVHGALKIYTDVFKQTQKRSSFIKEYVYERCFKTKSNLLHSAGIADNGTCSYSFFILSTEEFRIADYDVEPGISCYTIEHCNKRSLKEIGWRLGNVKWLAAGWLIPIFYAFIAYALIWLFNLGSVPNPVFLERARLTLSMPDQSPGLVIATAFVFITIVNLIPGLLFSLGEEIGWRGFMVPELSKWIGFRKASIWSGVIWCVWHLPGILSGSYGAESTPLWYRLSCFGIMVVSTSVMLAWLRMKSGSIWSVAIFHATHNGAVQTFFDRITADTGSTKYFTGEFGIAMVPVVVLLAWYFWKRSREVEGVN